MNSDIPKCCRGDLPDDVWYEIGLCDDGELVVALARQVPADSDLERRLVKAAHREWRHIHRQHHLPVIPIGAILGVGWLVRNLRRPDVSVPVGIAGAATAAMVAFFAVPADHGQGHLPGVAAPPRSGRHGGVSPHGRPRTSPAPAPSRVSPVPGVAPEGVSKRDRPSHRVAPAVGASRPAVRTPPSRRPPVVSVPTPPGVHAERCLLPLPAHVRVRLGKVRLCV